ncbi:carbamoyltransferase HypF [Amycolatopsis anabasis]|uniref:carbamoyltransferase HypF n=1 Tax=Amycolatopsis anabasis TaxID=1840409 RepID=UPI00131A7348|nr:carbamoyltransferase HypF [Amycolatopsis anabasis]
MDVRGPVRIEVHGTVQGVGFRPFVYRLATELGVSGDVCNAGGYVVIRADAPVGSLAEFLARLSTSAPPQAKVRGVAVHRLPQDTALPPDFRVVDSVCGHPVTPEVPPDLATCADCVRELFDPGDRRYRYPFLNCTNCGPRATIIQDLPYDRSSTAMRTFPLCPACSAEYHDPANRRFHAEPIACPDCGPQLAWYPASSESANAHSEEALTTACQVIADGGIVAVKGVGGYQLVCDAADEAAVARLREAKPRPSKPLAVMAPDLAAVHRLSTVDDHTAELLSSSAAPIVLLPRRREAPLAEGIAPGLTEVGVFLPYTPLHHLLLAELARPLVVTSGNRAGAPITIDDTTARTELGPIVDGILGHNRPIWSRYDDSVVRAAHGTATTVRRARGYAPAPLPLPASVPEPVLALGAQLKHTSALALGATAIVGPHTGDLDDARTFDAFDRAARDLCRLHDARAEFCAHDLHPGYLSTQYSRNWPAARRIGVQHHHAHVAATAAEHGIDEPFVGIALDGLGLGADGTFWGGEVLLATYRGYLRFGRFATAPLPGGAAAVRRPARMALGYLFGAERFGAEPVPEELARALLERIPAREVSVIRAMIHREVNCPKASSAGRLFDALAALLGLCDDNGYEGEAAVLLEAAAAGHSSPAPLRWELRHRDGLWVYDPSSTLRDALETAAGSPAGAVAARFHRTIAEVVVALAAKAASELGTDVVCLGGGVFQNALLTTEVTSGLLDAGLRPFAGERIPMNDGGISYGQAAIAAARMNGS